MSNILTLIRGDDKTLDLTITADGAAYDLTGATVFFTVKKKLTDSDANAVIKKDVTSHSNAAGGITIVELSNTDTNIAPGKYYWDIQLKDAAGKIMSTQHGTLNVIQDVTSRTS